MLAEVIVFAESTMIRKLPDGTILADTAQELADYETALKHANGLGSKARLHTDPAWRDLGSLLRESGKIMLTALYRAGAAGLSRGELETAIGNEGKGLGGVRGAVTKHVQNLGMKLDDVVRVGAGDRYYAGKLLLEWGPPP